MASIFFYPIKWWELNYLFITYILYRQDDLYASWGELVGPKVYLTYYNLFCKNFQSLCLSEISIYDIYGEKAPGYLAM